VKESSFHNQLAFELQRGKIDSSIKEWSPRFYTRHHGCQIHFSQVITRQLKIQISQSSIPRVPFCISPVEAVSDFSE